MATSFITRLPERAFTSQLPRLVAFSTTEERLHVYVTLGSNPERVTFTLYAHKGVARLYGLRQLLEDFMLAEPSSSCSYTIELDDQGSGRTTSGTLQAIYLDRHFQGEPEIFAQCRFLTSLTAKRVSAGFRDWIRYFAEPDTPEPVTMRFTLLPEGAADPVVEAVSLGSITQDEARIVTQEVSMRVFGNVLQAHSELAGAKILAATLEAGSRSFTYFVDHSFTPQLTLLFRNAFNCWECAELACEVTHKQEAELQLAQVGSRSEPYDQRTAQSFEVECAPMPREQADWLAEMLSSHEVRMADGREDAEDPTDFRQVIITDSTLEVAESDTELAEVKFTFRFTDESPHLLAPYFGDEMQQRIFTDEYSPQYS